MRCAHVGRCGGCTFYDLPYADELREKEAALRETLGEYGAILDTLHPAPNPEGYRNKMELAFGDTGNTEGAARQLALGIRKKRSMYEVATTENCLLIDDDFKQIAAYALAFFRASGEAVYHRKRHTGTLRHLVLRRGHFTGEVLVMLSTTSGLAVDLAPFVAGLRALPLRGEMVGILHAITDSVADAIKNENVAILYGRDFYREKLYDALTFHVSAFSFFQTNSAGAQVLYDIVRSYAGAGDTALDLYCGTGTIAQVIAPAFKRVVGLELVPEAVEVARANAELNGLTNCAFHAVDITQAAAQKHELLAVRTPDAVVVDPPRDGLSPKALAAVAAMDAARIVYVACKPASLARDLPYLLMAGYRLEKLTAVDMFPRTPHVEAVALLRKP